MPVPKTPPNKRASYIFTPQIKGQIFARAGVSGLQSLYTHLQQIDQNGSGLLERAELCEGLATFGLDMDDGPGGDVDKVMGFFDPDAGGRICIHEFHRALRVRYPTRVAITPFVKRLVKSESLADLQVLLCLGYFSIQCSIRRLTTESSLPKVVLVSWCPWWRRR